MKTLDNWKSSHQMKMYDLLVTMGIRSIDMHPEHEENVIELPALEAGLYIRFCFNKDGSYHRSHVRIKE